MDVTIDYMIRAHLPDVVEVEKAAWTFKDPDFGEYVHPLAWDEAKFISEVRRKNTVFFVLSEGELVVGYACVAKDKIKTANTIERLVVHPQFRRRGLGTALLADITGRSSCVKYHAQMYEHDDASIRFYASRGWVGKLARNLFGRDTNGVVFSPPQ